MISAGGDDGDDGDSMEQHDLSYLKTQPWVALLFIVVSDLV